MSESTGDSYNIDEVKANWIGKKTEVSTGRYPVEYDPIRRHCHMVEDDNPLFLDPHIAAQSQHGGVIAPPVMAGYFAGNGAWPHKPVRDALADVPTRGERKINMNIDWEYLIPVRIGDRLSSQRELIDIFEKPIKLDPKAVWIVTETRITNQNDEIVAIGRNTLLTHRTPEDVKNDN